jgi:AcrR family transcriptional regulator
MTDNATMAATRPTQPDGQAVPAIGLRERKKQKTREAIQRVAMRLFAKKGYDETTIEEIAAAVEISPSTFFNYFATKEDVVMLDTYDPMTILMFKDRPRNEPLSVSFRHVLQGLAVILERDRELILARSHLILGVPALRSRIWDEIERTQDFLVPLIAQRTGRNPDDYDLRVTARAVLNAVFEATLEWVRRDGRDDLVALIERALDVVGADAQLDALRRRKPTTRR